MSISLAEIEVRNPSGARRKRFFCPRCQPHGGKTPDLSVDRERGLYHCFKCGASGLLEEFHPKREQRRPAKHRGKFVLQAPQPEPFPEIPEEYVETCRRDFPGSPADTYEQSRGIDGVKTRMGYDPSFPFLVGDEWVHEPAVVFFFQDLDGRVVAKQGRMLRQAEEQETAKITFGKISLGVFNGHALAGEEVIVCEGPNTAAALVERGYPAIAIGGKTTQEWLLDVLKEKQVWIGLDNDEPGRKASAELLQALRDVGGEAETLLPPVEGQDWNDVLQSNPSFRLPWVTPVRYEPTLYDLLAQCRRVLRRTTGEARQMLEEWEFALDAGYEPARDWWVRNGDNLLSSLAVR